MGHHTDAVNTPNERTELIARCESNSIVFDTPFYDKPILSQVNAVTHTVEAQCPNCHATLKPGVFATPASRLVCAQIERMNVHISFDNNVRCGKSALRFDMDTVSGHVYQNKSGHTSDGKLCLNLSTCVWMIALLRVDGGKKIHMDFCHDLETCDTDHRTITIDGKIDRAVYKKNG